MFERGGYIRLVPLGDTELGQQYCAKRGPEFDYSRKRPVTIPR